MCTEIYYIRYEYRSPHGLICASVSTGGKLLGHSGKVQYKDILGSEIIPLQQAKRVTVLL